MMNMDWDDIDFEVPTVPGRRWYRAIDTGAQAPDDIFAEGPRAAVRGRDLSRQEPQHRGAHLQAVNQAATRDDPVAAPQDVR